MNLLKKLFYVLILIVFVCVLAIAALMYFIDPNQLKPVITKEVMKETGYKLVIDGDLSWSFYPTIGIKAQRMLLFNPGNKQPLVDLKDVSIASDVWQLIKGKQKLNGDIYISSASVQNIHTDEIHAAVAWHNKVLSLSPVIVNLYDGKLTGDMSASHLDKVPDWRWQFKLKDVDLTKLFNDIKTEKTPFNIQGRALFEMQAYAKGLKRSEFVDSLSGNASFSVENGVLQGINFDYLIESTKALIDKKPIPMPVNNETRFRRLSGSSAIEGGIAKTKDLIITSQSQSTIGEGSINLDAATIDMALQITPLTTQEFKWSIPVTVSGELENPRIKLDVMAINAMILKDQLQKVGEKVQKEVKRQIDNLPEKANEFIKSLTGDKK